MVWRTCAAHSPAPIVRVLNSADLGSAAGVGGQARVLAAVIDAGHFGGTVLVEAALWLRVGHNGRRAKGVPVSLQGWTAGAHLPVPPGLAPCSLGAGAGGAEGEALLGEPVTALVVPAV